MPPAVVACRPRVLEVRILLLGGSGQVGAEVQALAAAGSIDVLAPGRAEFDLKDPTAIARITGAGVCDAVINTAAYTDVDGAESEEAAAFAINAERHPEFRLRLRALESNYPYIDRLRVRRA